MWKVLPKLGLLKLLLLIFSTLYLASLLVLLSSQNNSRYFAWEHFGSALELATPVTIGYLLIIYTLGKWGWLAIWKCPGLGSIVHKSVCPNLNGTWTGFVHSNYPDEDGNHLKKDVVLIIKADLFGFDVSLRSVDGYQESKVVQSEIYKDPRNNTFYLSYIFEASVPVPKETDDRMFEGAAKLEVIIREDSTDLKGTYWTNRAWQRRNNTAGMISVTRSSS